MRQYTPSDFLDLLRDVDQVVKSKTMSPRVKHEILTEIINTFPHAMYCSGSKSTAKHALEVAQEALKLVDYTAPVAPEHADSAPTEPSGVPA